MGFIFFWDALHTKILCCSIQVVEFYLCLFPVSFNPGKSSLFQTRISIFI